MISDRDARLIAQWDAKIERMRKKERIVLSDREKKIIEQLGDEEDAGDRDGKEEAEKTEA